MKGNTYIQKYLKIGIVMRLNSKSFKGKSVCVCVCESPTQSSRGHVVGRFKEAQV